MHVHMKPAQLQHVETPQQTRRAAKTNESEADVLVKMYGDDEILRRRRSSARKNGPFNPPYRGRKSFAAALTALDVFGPEASTAQQKDAPASADLSELLALAAG